MFFYNYYIILFFISMLMFFFSLKFLILNFIIFIEWEIISMNTCSIVMTFLFDWMSLLFMSFVLFISSLIIFYSKTYMKEDFNKIRFLMLILLFIFSMMMLIISPNLISILLGWDGLGLVSYCLVIYFQNVKSYNAGMLTALSNRIGDVMLLMAISWMLNFGNWNFFFFLEFFKMDKEMNLIMILVMIAAMTKSAQIPFSSWLPAAMAAPTPVSALVHSSTLVTAGVYLMIRFNLLFNNMLILNIFLVIGILTMFMSGLGANFEMDLKKIIALSTLSQLGLMMSIYSISFFKLAFFHLLSHALFKALLFMCAGSFIHNMMNYQDIRIYGNLFNQMPLTSVCFNISSLALCGLPFLAGFYSKDLILEMVCMQKINFIIFFLFFFSTMLTVSYSFRLIFFSMSMSISNFSILNYSDNSWVMLNMMIILSFVSIFGGSILSWLIFPNFYFIILPKYLKYLILMVCILGMLIGYIFSGSINIYMIKNFNNIMIKFYSMMWFMPFIFSLKFNLLFLKLGMTYKKNLDLGWSEFMGSIYLLLIINKFIKINQKIQFNQLKNILISYLIIILLLFIYLM